MKVKVTINGKSFLDEDNLTILQVALKHKINIPTLCHLKDIVEEADCRICVVENEQTHKLVPACATKITDGLSVLTESKTVVENRKNTLKLMLSTHHKDCMNCAKNGKCDLQKLFMKYKIYETPYKYSNINHKLDTSSPCIVRDDNKCILCGRCIAVCSKIQQVNALTKIGRGFSTYIGCPLGVDLKHSPCVGCGQCSLVCPTGAIVEHSEIDDVLKLLNDPKKHVYAQVAPSVRVSLAEYFGEPIGSFDEGRMVNALHKLGFEKVFDINLGADFTVVEESNELLERLKTQKDLPLFSSCCPAWFKYINEFYKDYSSLLSSCKSPTEMLGAIVKNYYAKLNNIDINDIAVVGIMPCTAKKGEKQRAKDVDNVLTTRELAKLIDNRDIDYINLKPKKFDTPLADYSGAGLIFGVTGGVTEAVLRNVAKMQGIDKIEFGEVRNSAGRKEIEVKLGNSKLHLCVVNGLANAKNAMDDIVSGKVHYDFMEVMACPGGCINGGGQNYVNYKVTPVDKVKKLRSQSLYNADTLLNVRSSGDNKSMQKVYKDFFIPTKGLAHKLLHYKK